MTEGRGCFKSDIQLFSIQGNEAVAQSGILPVCDTRDRTDCTKSDIPPVPNTSERKHCTKKKKKSCTKSATVPVRREGQRESAAVLIFKFLNFVYVACPHEDASFERVKAHCDRLSSCGGVW